MNPPAGPEVLQLIRHEHLLPAARALADQPGAAEAGLSFDDAYAAVAHLHVRYGSTMAEDVAMPAGTMFATAEAFDVIMTHGDQDQRLRAATMVAGYADYLPVSTDAEAKRGILASVLGIEVPSDIPVSRQLVERYLLPGGGAEEQLALIGLIEARRHRRDPS